VFHKNPTFHLAMSKLTNKGVDDTKSHLCHRGWKIDRGMISHTCSGTRSDVNFGYTAPVLKKPSEPKKVMVVSYSIDSPPP